MTTTDATSADPLAPPSTSPTSLKGRVIVFTGKITVPRWVIKNTEQGRDQGEAGGDEGLVPITRDDAIRLCEALGAFNGALIKSKIVLNIITLS